MEIIKLNLIPSGVNPTCHCSQYDNGRVIRIDLFDGLTPYVLQSGDTVTLNVRKPDNTIVTTSLTATQGNTYVNLVTTEQICACVGYNLCDLTITNESVVIGTLNFIMQVERDVLADGIPSQSVIDDLDALVQEAVGDQYYTKTETDAALDLKADKSTTYTKTQVDSALALKADKSDTYTKTQVDNLLADKANAFIAPLVKPTFENKYIKFTSEQSKQAALKLESNENSVDIWHYSKNMLPLITESFTIANVTVTIENDGTLVFNGTTNSQNAVKEFSLFNLPVIWNGNNPFDSYIINTELNKACPNSSGYVIIKVLNNANHNFFSRGIDSATPLKAYLTNSYGDETTYLKAFQIQFYNVPIGTVFSDFRIKASIEKAVYPSDYEKPSLYHTTASITDGKATKDITLFAGENNIITNADKTKLQTVLEVNTESIFGKRWACFGDSITQKNDESFELGWLRYYDIISKELCLDTINYGRATTGYSTTGSTADGEFYKRVLKVKPQNFDFMTIFGSINDVSRMVQGYISLGDITDSGTTTVCGCINTTLDNYYSVAPLKPLGVISLLPTYVCGPDLVDFSIAENYVNALEEICKRRGIPFLDLYHSSGMRPWITEVKSSLYFEGDGIHPNNEGIKWFAPKIREFIKTLI